MAVSIKNKIRFGTLFLFSLVILIGGLCIYYLNQTKKESKNILNANYESLDYCHKMQGKLDSLEVNANYSLIAFDTLIQHQEKNVTENGESKATADLRVAFNRLQKGDTSLLTVIDLRNNIQRILNVNMQAIVRKSNEAEQHAENASTIIILITAVSFIIGLTFSFNFPDVVVVPINKLIDAIKEISAKNYKHRIHLNTQDEFKQLADAFNIMAERIEEFESSNLNKLIFEKARAEAVINSLKDASIGIDKNEKVLFANRQALSLLGLEAGEMVGAAITKMAERNDLFRFLMKNDSSTPFKIVVEDKENYYIKEVIDATPEDAFSRIIVLKNITSFKELDVAKTNFIATVSHELKTPLASSDFSLKLLEDERVGQLSNEQQALVRQLKDDNQRMLKILSELLNMSQVDAGKIQLQIAPAKLDDIIETAQMAVSSALKQHEIKVVKDTTLSGYLNLDADKIGWVLTNFLTNAIRFSPPGGTVTVTTKKTEKGISVAVQDQGPGIDPMYFDKVFERFFKIPGQSQKAGSGIGLAICKELIQTMGGEIWVKSNLGEGSTFGFDLPTSPPAPFHLTV